ncbi:hypothetical protein [Pedobacter borealis]|uniref:hypothetical protein n=1 Tax=Pedobacter borealis TaxID=475254 RepID=UPI0012F75ED0|nr:hypothetical protein [Pedobacter borealis]
MTKSIDNLISKLGGNSSGFLSIKGGARSLIAEENANNQSNCSNSGTCTGTNSGTCTNYDCEKATNSTPGSCTNSHTCFA